MDSKRFNELAKALASGQSRRGVVKGLAAGLVGGAFGFIGRDRADAAAIKRKPGRSCRENADCVSDAICLFDGRRRICACDFIYERCLNNCFQVNQTSTFQFNQDTFCEQVCSIEAAQESKGLQTCNLR